MKNTNADIAYVIIDNKGVEHIVEGRCATEALGIFLKRGRFGLGKGWVLTRQSNGWLVCSNKADKTLGRTMHKLREVGWSRFETYSHS